MPRVNSAKVWPGSDGLRVSRIHITSIGDRGQSLSGLTGRERRSDGHPLRRLARHGFQVLDPVTCAQPNDPAIFLDQVHELRFPAASERKE